MSLLLRKKAKKLIEQANHILLITDERIDGDTIGATLGMYHVLDELGKRVEVYSPKPMAKTLEFIPGTEVIQRHRAIFEQDTIDLVMVFDCADGVHFQPHVEKLPTGTPILVFDHHATNPEYGTLNFIEPDAASASDVVWRFIRHAEYPINKQAAQAILTGITTDTNAFSTANTTPEALEAATELVKHGAKLQDIVRQTMMNKSVPTLKLWGIAFERLHEHPDFEATVTAITRDDLTASKALEEDLTGLSNFLYAMLEEAGTVIVLRETEDGGVKASCRSNTRDVAKLAEKYGGGGHTKAAGFKVEKAKLVEVDDVWRIMKPDGTLVQ